MLSPTSFDGQSKSEAHFSVVRESPLGTQFGTCSHSAGAGQSVDVNRAKLCQNCHAVEERNDIDSASSGTPLEGWELLLLGTGGDVASRPGHAWSSPSRWKHARVRLTFTFGLSTNLPNGTDG